jgi:hypothetical protein
MTSTAPRTIAAVAERYYFAAFFFAAQYAFIRAACFFRCTMLKVVVILWPFSGAGSVASELFGGRPRRFVPCKTSIALVSLSRSWIRRATIWSVGI